MTENKRPIGVWIATPIAVIFGLMTIKSGGSVLFFDGAARQAAGNYVPFVLWFNFLAGFLYVITGIGLWLRKRWAVKFAIVLALATLAVFAVLGVHILNDGNYETRTVAAMTIRSTIWVAIAGMAWFLWQPRQDGQRVPE